MTMTTWFKAASLFMISLLALAGCTAGGGAGGSKTSVRVTFADARQIAKAVGAVPSNVQRVEISAVPANPANVTPAPVSVLFDLPAGHAAPAQSADFAGLTDNETYTFEVWAYDINDVATYRGSASQLLLPGNNTVSITCFPYTPPAKVGDTWAARAAMPTARSRTASAQVNGKIYVIGGEGAPGTALATVEEYDPVSNSWAAKAAMPTARRYAAAAAWGNRIFVFGGEDAGGTPISTVEVFDPAGNSWSTPPINGGSFTPRARLSAVSLNGRIFVIGGTDFTVTPVTTVEVYNPINSTWIAGPPLTTARARFGAVVGHDGSGNSTISVMGGDTTSAGNPTNSVEYLADPYSNWAAGTSLPAIRTRFGVTVAGTSAYLAGGRDGAGTMTNVAWRYDFWNQAAGLQPVAPMPTMRNYPAIQEVNGKVYVIGGADAADAPFATVEEYTPANSVPRIGTPVTTISMTNIGGFKVAGTSGIMLGQTASNGPLFYQYLSLNPFASAAAPVALGITAADPVSPEAEIALGGGVYGFVITEPTGVWFRTLAAPSPGAVLSTRQLENFAANDQIRVRVDFDGTNFLVVWNDLLGTIKGQFVSPAGALVGTVFNIGSGNLESLVYGNGSYLLINSLVSGPDLYVNGQMILVNGTLSDFIPSILQMPGTVINGAHAVFNGSFFVVAAALGTNAGQDIYVRSVALQGPQWLPYGQTQSATSDNTVQREMYELRWDGIKFLGTWEEVDGAGNVTMYGRFGGSNATFMGPLFALTPSLGVGGGAGAFWAPALDSYLLGWNAANASPSLAQMRP